MRFIVWILLLTMMTFSCNRPKGVSPSGNTMLPLPPGNKNQYVTIATGKTTPAELIMFARTLEGAPYKYGSVSPDEGFDCSGFVTYVFNHFGIRVPRQSVGFTYVNKEIDISEAKPGDLILFTGTDPTIRIIGHIGMILSVQGGNIIFIHATSGKECAITESAFDLYYQERYIKTIRVFPQNDLKGAIKK